MSVSILSLLRQELATYAGRFTNMSEIAKHIGGALRRAYASVLKRPMPWNIIDKLTTLEEKCEAQDDAPKRADGANRDGAGDGRPSTSAAGNELPKTRS